MEIIPKQLIFLDDKNKDEFKNFLKKMRKNFIKQPKETLEEVIVNEKSQLASFVTEKEISKLIIYLREKAYYAFLLEEQNFNKHVLVEIGRKFALPHHFLTKISHELYEDKENLSYQDFINKVNTLFGAYAGNISPYIYELCLSNTQSRRSRSGKMFEHIIYYLYTIYEYPFDSQSAIGRKVFTDLNTGKVVDSILPSVKAFSEFRNKTIVETMKTTLRERWQEVVEEIDRSKLPNIHLLTVDDNIAISKVTQMAKHNIVLVVLKEIKNSVKLNKERTVIDFETYFFEEISNILAYWRK